MNQLYRLSRSAYNNLAAMGLRSLLAMIGIIIGIASVVAMVSGGQMAAEASLQNLRALGTNLIAIMLIPLPVTNKQQETPVLLDQVLSIKSLNPAIQFLAPYVSLFYTASYKGNQLNTPIVATTQDLADILRLKIKTGRFISPYDKYKLFCVIGYQLFLKMNLRENNAVGTNLHIGNNVFTIIGVLSPSQPNMFFTDNINESVIIPLENLKLLSMPINIHNMIMRVNKESDINHIESVLAEYTKKRWPNKKLELHSPRELIINAQKQSDIFNILLGLIGGISLLVGGIGVMNTMLVSVLERRQEIGIRISLGATPGEIQRMFLSEAIILSVTGGIIGILIGILCTYIVSKFTSWPFLLLLWPPVLGFIVSFLTGAFFGYYPARRASKLNAIDTLRAE